MNNYYERLAESLTKKYSTPLNEAWGNVPDWMKGPLARGDNSEKMKKSKVYQKAFADAQAQGQGDHMADITARKAWEDAKGITRKDFADYRQPRGSWSSDSAKTLHSQFMAKGIDLNNPNMKFIEGDPPKSKQDPRLQPPNIGIWYIPSREGRKFDQVYAQGINDLEKPYKPEKSIEGTDKPFMKISLKSLAEISSKFCYIDGTTIKNRDFTELDNIRAKNKNDYKIAINKGLERVPKSMNNWRIRDKSGYIVIPSSQKYAEKLEEIRLKGWAKKLAGTENELNSLLSTYQKTISTIDILDFDNPFRDAAKVFTDAFTTAVDFYKLALQEIDYIKSKYTVNSEDFLWRLKNSYFQRYLENCQDNLSKAKDVFKDYMLSEIDF